MNSSVPLKVTHDTTYHYATRVELAHHVAYLRPIEDDFQQLDEYRLDVFPEPSHRTSDRDAFGNARDFFSLYVSHDGLKVRAQSRVRVAARFAGLEPMESMPWEAVREALSYAADRAWLPQSEFTFASPFVVADAAMRDYARTSFLPGRPILDGAIDLMHRIHADFRYASHSTQVSTPTAEAFRMKRGVCQDFAHIFVACLRSHGLAARYVSGYLLTMPRPGQPRLLGADASHAWISVYSPDCDLNGGWIDLDPTNDLIPATSHVILAVGRDYGDVAPLRGVIRGGGDHTLTVGVSVEPEEPEQA